MRILREVFVAKDYRQGSKGTSCIGSKATSQTQSLTRFDVSDRGNCGLATLFFYLDVVCLVHLVSKRDVVSLEAYKNARSLADRHIFATFYTTITYFPLRSPVNAARWL